MRPLRHAAAVLVLAAAASGCVDTGPETAYCSPQAPVLTPVEVEPGEELMVEVPGVVEGDGCEPRLPDGAGYRVELRIEGSTTSLGTIRPGGGGGWSGAFTLQADVPAGLAELSLGLEGARTICEIDPTMSCGKDPFALVEVTG